MRYHILISAPMSENKLSPTYLGDRALGILDLERFNDLKRLVLLNKEITQDLQRKFHRLSFSNYLLMIFKNPEIIELAERFPDFNLELIILPLKELLNSFLDKKDGLVKNVECLSKMKPVQFAKKNPKQKEEALKHIADYPIPFFLYDGHGMTELAKMLKADDTIVLHGEGVPMVCGLDVGSVFDLYPEKLGALLTEYDFPKNLRFNLELLSCHSASTWQGINFAQLTAQVLKYCHGFRAVSVLGYSAYIVEKGGGKFSASLDTSNFITKGKRTVKVHNVSYHLEDCQVKYQDGTLIQAARKQSNIESNVYDWAGHHIAKIHAEKTKIFSTVVRVRALEYLSSLPVPKTPEEWQVFSDLMARIEDEGIIRALPDIKAQVAIELDWSDLSHYFTAPIAKIEVAEFLKPENLEAYSQFCDARQRAWSKFVFAVKSRPLDIFSLWAQRNTSRETREAFDQQFGLTVASK